MALITGNDGDLTFAAGTVPVRTWELNTEATEKETTNSGTASNSRAFLADRSGSTWTAEVYSDDATAEQGVGGSSVAMELIAKGGGITDKKWTFSGIVLGATIVCNIVGGDAVLIRYSGRVDGAVTKVQYS